jgi:hypothetical protein
MDSEFDNWIYWHLFTITISYCAVANLAASQITKTYFILVLVLSTELFCPGTLNGSGPVLPTALSIELTLESECEHYITTDGLE